MRESQAMSSRDGRDSRSRRDHSRSQREPSPKKSRRDGKQATERTYTGNHHLDVNALDREQKRQRRLQDALPLENPPATATQAHLEIIEEGLEKKPDGLPDGATCSSDPPKIPRSSSYFQHDERGSAGHAGRSSVRSATDHGRRSDPKEQPRDRLRDKEEPQKTRTDGNKVWRHDGYFGLETETPPARKRPAFREKKIEALPETVAVANGSEAGRFLPPVRREERGHYSRGSDERAFLRGGEMQRGSYQSRERFVGRETRGRDEFNGRYSDRNTHRPGGMQVDKWKHDLFDEANGRYGDSAHRAAGMQVDKWKHDLFDVANGRYGDGSTHRPAGFQADKWKHDLFDEANKSPPQKNDEEQIAKVEALLSL